MSFEDKLILSCNLFLHLVGVNSFKAFMAYKGTIQLPVADLYHMCKTCSDLGAIAQVHAEDGDVIAEVGWSGWDEIRVWRV